MNFRKQSQSVQPPVEQQKDVEATRKQFRRMEIVPDKPPVVMRGSEGRK